MTPAGDLILERVIGGDEIDDAQMEELLKLFRDYDSGKYDPNYISELALNRFAGHFIADKGVLRAMRLKRSVKTMLQVVNKFFNDRDSTAAAREAVSTRTNSRNAARAKAKAKAKAVAKAKAKAKATADSHAESTASSAAELEAIVLRSLEKDVDGELRTVTPATPGELAQVKKLLKDLRSSRRTHSASAEVETPRNDLLPIRAFGSRTGSKNPELGSDSDDDPKLLDFDDGAEKFFAACPLRAYRKGTTAMSMTELLQLVSEVKAGVQEWDIVLMNRAKRFLPDHLRAIVTGGYLPPGIDNEGPIRLTKRYIAALRRFSAKHKGARLEKGVRKPKKRPLFDLTSGDDSDSSSAEDDDEGVARKLAKLQKRLLPTPESDPVDPYMVGEIKRVMDADVAYKRHHPE